MKCNEGTNEKKFSLKDKQKQIWKMLIALIQQQQHTIRSKDKDKRKCSIEKKRGNMRKKRSRRENDIHTELQNMIKKGRRDREKEREKDGV